MDQPTRARPSDPSSRRRTRALRATLRRHGAPARRAGLLLAIGLALASALEAGAQVVAFPADLHGSVIDASAFSVGDVVPIFASVAIPPGDDPADYVVRVGSSEPRSVAGAGSLFDVGLGPAPPPWFASYGWTWSDVPYGSLLQSELSAAKPLAAILYHVPTARIVSVDRVVVFDGRRIHEEDADAPSANGVVQQISPMGLEALETTHEEPLPWPGIGDFNEEMDGNIAKVAAERARELDTAICLPITEVLDFKDTDAWGDVLVDAWAAYTSWQAADQVCQGAAGACAALGPAGSFACTLAACLAADLACVDEMPRPADFEVCFDRLEGELRAQSVARLAGVDLGISPSLPDTIDADVRFEGLGAWIDVRLTDFEIRYAEGGASCFPRPRREVDELEIGSHETLSKWSLCRDNSLEAEEVCSTCTSPDYPPLPGTVSTPSHFELLDGLGSERIEAGDPGGLGLMLDGVSTRVAPATTCSTLPLYAELRPEVEELIADYQSVARDLVEVTWSAPASGIPHVDHFEDLLAPMGIGAYAYAAYEPDVEVFDVTTHPDHGISGISHAAVQLEPEDPKAVLENGDPATQPLFAGPAALPRYDDVPYFLDGESPAPASSPFDAVYAFRTGFANRLLADRAWPELAMAVEPSWSELGLAPPTGTRPDASVPLDANTLARWAPPLADAGPGTPLALMLEPTIAPYLWMPSDWPDLEAPLFFNAPQLSLRIVDDLGFVWAEFVVDQLENELTFHFAGLADDPFLVHQPDPAARWGAAMVASALPSCDVHSAWDPARPNGCGKRLARAVADLLGPRLDAARTAMLDEVPAAQYYDQEGRSEAPVVLRTVERIHSESYVILFGDFEAAPTTTGP